MIFANLDTCSTRGTPIYLLFLQNHHIESISFPNYSFRQIHYSQLSMQNSKLSQNSWIWILPLSPLFCSHRKPIPSGRWYICICARFSLFWKKTFAPCLPQRANREYPLVIILSLFRDTLIPPRSRKRFLYIDDKKLLLKARRRYHTGNAQSFSLPEQKRKHCAKALDLLIAAEPARVSEYGQ